MDPGELIRTRMLVNQYPMNQVARELLPPEWRDDAGTLHVLALMGWYLENNQIRGARFSQEVLEEKVARLADWDPEEAMEYLTTAESPEDVMLTDLPPDPED